MAGDDGFVTNPLLADTDGDEMRDGLEVQFGSDPTVFDLLVPAAALESLAVTPSAFTLVSDLLLIIQASQQLTVTGTLADGFPIDLTSTTRGTNYESSNIFICNFGAEDGEVFAGDNGICTVIITNGDAEVSVPVTVDSVPRPLSFVAIPGFANNVDVSGDFAYVAAGSTGLQVVDVSDRSTPVVIGSVDTPGNANDVRVVDSTAFIADGSSGLQVVDVSDPANPTIIGAVDTPGVAWDVVVDGNLAYVADGASGLQIIDVSDPTSPSITGAVDTPGTAKGVDVNPAVGLAVVADGTAGLQVVDISNPAIPALQGVVDTGDARDVALDTDFAFVAEFTNNSFTTVDISDPMAPVIAATVNRTVGGLLMDVALKNGFAFGADVFFVNGVPVILVSDPANPAPRAILNFSNFRDDNGTGIAVDQQYVYLTGERGITENGVNGNTRLYIGQYRAITDDLGVPPEVNITSPSAGVDVVEGSTLPITVEATDDVQVVAVDLLLDGAVVATDSSAPYEFNIPVPLGAGPLNIGATAIDLGSNIGVAPDVVVTVVPDTFPPTIESFTFEQRSVSVRFNEPIAAGSATAANFQLTDASDVVIIPLSVELRNGDRTVFITYDPLPGGNYTLTIVAAAVTDRAGNPLGIADITNQFFRLAFFLETFEGGASGSWSNGTTTVNAAFTEFLGRFGNQTVSVTLNNLPPHTGIELHFDFFAIDSWDGSDPTFGGPDEFLVGLGASIDDLFKEDFVFFNRGNPAQSYTITEEEAPAGNRGFGGFADAIYRDLNNGFSFPHQSATVTFNFTGQGLQGLADESWGIDNVSVVLVGVP